MPLPTPRNIERAGLLAWPGIEVEWDGSWVRRAANGYTRRANCLQCFDPADGTDAAARLGAAKSWFAARNLPPIVRSTPLSCPALDAVLDAEGWAIEARTEVFAMALTDSGPDGGGRTFALSDPAFLAAQQRLRKYDDANLARLRALLGAMTVPAAGIVIYRDGEPVSTCLTAIADNIAITGNVVTDPARRRQGLGAALMRTAHHWAGQNGATLAALNVEADNAPARALYGSVGYTRQYDYHYRVAGARA